MYAHFKAASHYAIPLQGGFSLQFCSKDGMPLPFHSRVACLCHSTPGRHVFPIPLQGGMSLLSLRVSPWSADLCRGFTHPESLERGISALSPDLGESRDPRGVTHRLERGASALSPDLDSVSHRQDPHSSSLGDSRDPRGISHPVCVKKYLNPLASCQNWDHMATWRFAVCNHTVHA